MRIPFYTLQLNVAIRMEKLPRQLYSIIKQLPYDLRAEVVLADLVERGLNPDLFLVSAKGSFKRRFSRDLEQVSNLETGRKIKYILAEINREGIYDALPQAITHGVKNRKKTDMKTSTDMVGEVKERRKEEEAARKFFLPFENEFHQQCIELEMAERNILKGFLSNSKYIKLMNEFWEMPPILTESQKAAFIYLLPVIHKAAGDLNLTQQCYEAILDVNIELTIKTKPRQTDHQSATTEFILGTNFVCGTQVYNYSTYYEISIGPLDEVRLEDYLPGKKGRMVIEFLNGYYLPFDADHELVVCTMPGINEFVLNNASARLDYSTCI